MEFISNPKIILASLLLLAGVVTDLRSKKVPNALIVVGFVLALIAIAVMDGKGGYWPAFASLGTATIFAFPLYYLRAIGGGDLKLIWVVSLLLSWNMVITMILASLVWGALLGIIRVIVAGKGKLFLQNLLAIIKKNRPADDKLSHVPFTIAIFFGFLTSLSLLASGFSWV
jgi:prepilin peptidase CpaA